VGKVALLARTGSSKGISRLNAKLSPPSYDDVIAVATRTASRVLKNLTTMEDDLADDPTRLAHCSTVVDKPDQKKTI